MPVLVRLLLDSLFPIQSHHSNDTISRHPIKCSRHHQMGRPRARHPRRRHKRERHAIRPKRRQPHRHAASNRTNRHAIHDIRIRDLPRRAGKHLHLANLRPREDSLRRASTKLRARRRKSDCNLLTEPKSRIVRSTRRSRWLLLEDPRRDAGRQTRRPSLRRGRARRLLHHQA